LVLNKVAMSARENAARLEAKCRRAEIGDGGGDGSLLQVARVGNGQPERQ